LKKKDRVQLTIISCAGIFVFALSIVITERLVPEFENIFNLLHSQAGAIISANLLGFLIAILIGGILSDFLSEKILILSGFGLLILGALIFGCANNYKTLLLGNLLLGISGGLLEGLLSLVIMEMFFDRRGMVMNLSQVFFGMGAAIAPFFATIFITWRIPYLILSIISLFIALNVAIKPFPSGNKVRKQKSTLTVLFFNSHFFMIVTGMFFYSCTEMGIVSWISALFIKEMRAPEIWGTLVLSSYWGGQFLGRLTVGLNVDKYLAERFISLFFFLSSLLIFLALISKTVVLSFIFFTMTGFTMAPLWPTILSDARNKFTDYPGTAFGIIAAAGAFAGIIVPTLIGRIADLSSISRGLFLTSGTSFSGTTTYLYIHMKNRKRGKPV